MSRYQKTLNFISNSRKNILFFQSDEYGMIKNIINTTPFVFCNRFKDEIDENIFQKKDVFEALKSKKHLNVISIENMMMNSRISFSNFSEITICENFDLFTSNNNDFRQQAQLLESFVEFHNSRNSLLLLSGASVKFPINFSHLIDVFDVPFIDQDDISEILTNEATKINVEFLGQLSKGESSRIEDIIPEFRGLSTSEINDVIYKLNSKYGNFYGKYSHEKKPILQFNPIDDDFKAIAKYRKSLIDDIKKTKALIDNTLTFIDTKKSIAGYRAYINWFKKRKETLENPILGKKKGREPIRGVLITGLPGTGKTQGAKFTAKELNLPLVEFRFENLLGGRVGDSEKKFKLFRKRVENLAPCVVLIDEIEKIFGASENQKSSSDVKNTLMSAMLGWLQENNKNIFFYATCNSVKDLKPELLRDLRFSMRFYAFLPNHDELVDIICYHIKRINDLPKQNKLDKGLFHGTNIINDNRVNSNLAVRFLDEITEYAQNSERNMFFTGANIEALLNTVQDEYYDISPNCDEYCKRMLECAKSFYCQPFAEGNMDTVVNFWISTYYNKFANVSEAKEEIFSFEDFKSTQNGSKSINTFSQKHLSNKYDQYMFNVISKCIESKFQK